MEGKVVRLVEEETRQLVVTVQAALRESPTRFDACRLIAACLGAQRHGDFCQVGFSAPELRERRVPDGDIFLEVLEPAVPLRLTTAQQQAQFLRQLVPLARADEFCLGLVDGMQAGSRDLVGSFYALVWRDGEGVLHRILDPLAASLLFGAFAPAEYYDVAAMQAERDDLDYYAALPAGDPVKLGPAANILQVHVPTATAGMTLASLTQHMENLADRYRRGDPPEPADRLFLGYEAMQLMPVEPATVYESGPAFWEELGSQEPVLEVRLRRPDTANWGYDVLVAGMAAVNPALLESGRPDELVDLVAALHNFPGGPKKLILDVVYGHGDNQALDVLNSHFFSGPNMYGQNVNYRNPVVRAILLEMQRRKVNFGADGVRVDGAQAFKWWDTDQQVLCHDDEYLQLMADVVQDVEGWCYRPWFIFEDGRPWPEEDWELSSTYRAVIERQRDPDVFQWGPLSFAHNTPFLYTFWLAKWWRIEEILRHGENWISGCANHDTLRRGTQVSTDLNINTRRGDTLMEILDKAYDNPAAQLLTYACLPGVPMDFLNACARASWGFIRNQDDRFGVKVVAEEAISLKWQVDTYSYSIPPAFRRLKDMGFVDRDSLARFLEFLPALVKVTEYDLNVIATLLNEVDPPLVGPAPYTVAVLKAIARDWMDDMHDYCNVSRDTEFVGDTQARFMLALREFRLQRPWLRNNLLPEDVFDYRRLPAGSVCLRSLRHGPDGEQVLAVVHMEGQSIDSFEPIREVIPGLVSDGWELQLRTPPLQDAYAGGELDLRDSMGLVYVRRPPR